MRECGDSGNVLWYTGNMGGGSAEGKVETDVSDSFFQRANFHVFNPDCSGYDWNYYTCRMLDTKKSTVVVVRNHLRAAQCDLFDIILSLYEKDLVNTDLMREKDEWCEYGLSDFSKIYR